MLRIITPSTDAQSELWRIRDRVLTVELFSYEPTVRAILDKVRQEGDQALTDSEIFPDPPSLRSLKVSGSALDAAYQQISKDLLVAIQKVCKQLEYFHSQRIPKSWVHFAESDVVFAKRYHPYPRAGLYVEGSQGAGVGSLLMQAIPAKIARVPHLIAMITPERTSGTVRDASALAQRDRKIHPALLVAAQEAGIHEIYALGGVEAIAALAYGTETLPKVDIITGSGDGQVTLAKKLLQGTVVTDRPLEKSDLMIIADSTAKAEWIAADILAQIEQDPNAALLLLTPDVSLAREVQQLIYDRLPNHSQGILAEKAIAHYGLIILLDSLEQSIDLANQYAPQSLMLAVEDPWSISQNIHNVGTIFLGHHTPRAIGEYVGGSFLTLPSVGKTRYPCQLGVETFLRSSQLLDYSAVELANLSQSLQQLAELEGRPDTAETIQLRQQSNSSAADF